MDILGDRDKLFRKLRAYAVLGIALDVVVLYIGAASVGIIVSIVVLIIDVLWINAKLKQGAG